MPSLTLHYTPTEKDYVQTVQAFYRHDWRIWLTVGLTGLLFISGAAYLAFGPPSNGFFGLALLVPLPSWVAYLFVLWPVRLGRQVRKDQQLRSATTWVVSDDQVLVKDEFSTTRFAWGDFHRVIETRQHYLLLFAANRRASARLPKRALTSAEQEGAFRDLVGQHLPGLGTASLSR